MLLGRLARMGAWSRPAGGESVYTLIDDWEDITLGFDFEEYGTASNDDQQVTLTVKRDGTIHSDVLYYLGIGPLNIFDTWVSPASASVGDEFEVMVTATMTGDAGAFDIDAGEDVWLPLTSDRQWGFTGNFADDGAFEESAIVAVHIREVAIPSNSVSFTAFNMLNYSSFPA